MRRSTRVCSTLGSHQTTRLATTAWSSSTGAGRTSVVSPPMLSAVDGSSGIDGVGISSDSTVASALVAATVTYGSARPGELRLVLNVGNNFLESGNLPPSVRLFFERRGSQHPHARTW